MSGFSSDGIRVELSREKSVGQVRRCLCLSFAGLLGIALLALLLIPAVRNGAEVLCNRLFAASEAVNAYAYEYFAVDAAQSTAAAWVCLSVIVLSMLELVVCGRNPLFILLCALLTVGAQAYFGLSLPAWLNVTVFFFLGFFLVRGKISPGMIVSAVVILLGISLLIVWRYPGVDPWIESRSEVVRDRLTRAGIAAEFSGGVVPDEPIETRHVNSRTLIEGENESQTRQGFRIVTEDEQQISLPDWAHSLTSYLPAVLGAVLVLCLVFGLYRVISGRRAARASRKIFDSDDRAAAICAMFRHIAAWLESFGYGGGNLPYRDWVPSLNSLPEGYAEHFRESVPDFERAFYSEYQPDEEALRRVRELLTETEELLYHQADCGKRLRLKYVECLYL